MTIVATFLLARLPMLRWMVEPLIDDLNLLVKDSSSLLAIPTTGLSQILLPWPFLVVLVVSYGFKHHLVRPWVEKCVHHISLERYTVQKRQVKELLQDPSSLSSLEKYFMTVFHGDSRRIGAAMRDIRRLANGDFTTCFDETTKNEERTTASWLILRGTLALTLVYFALLPWVSLATGQVSHEMDIGPLVWSLARGVLFWCLHIVDSYYETTATAARGSSHDDSSRRRHLKSI